MSWSIESAGRTRDRVIDRRILEALVLLGYAAVTCRQDRPPTRVVVGGAPVSAAATAVDTETIKGPHHFSDGYPTENDDGSINAVIEIPAGTTGKFEVDDKDGWMRWRKDRDDGSRREVDYLPFLVNYGMVPRTLAQDGDPLDVIVLGRGIERARIAKTRVIGVLKMADDGDVRDDKLVAVSLDADLENGFSRLHELTELDIHYPASRDILFLWFSHYWGKGVTDVLGWGDAREARKILDDARL